MDAAERNAEGTIGAAASIRLRLENRPESVTLVRSMLAGIGEYLHLGPELQDDLKTAVSEACNNVVLHAYEGELGPMRLDLEVDSEGLHVLVADDGVGIQRVSPAENRMGVGLAVISALAERAEFQSSPGEGTEVRMSFASHAGGNSGQLAVPMLVRPAPALPAGDITAAIAPVELLPQVLGRLVRGVAAGAHFPVDRFPAMHQLTSAISVRAADRDDQVEIGFALTSSPRRIEISIAPLPAGTGAALLEDEATGNALRPILERVDAVPLGNEERLAVVLVEPRD